MLRATLLFMFLFTGAAQAYNAQCDVELDGTIEIEDQQLHTWLPDGRKVTFNGETALIDEQPLALNEQQQQLVNEYHASSQRLAPKVANMALDGLDIAHDTIVSVLGGLFGEDDELVNDITQQIGEWRQDLYRQFYTPEGTLKLNSQRLNDHYLTAEFEQKVESKVDDILTRAMGKMMTVMGKEMLSGEGDMSSFSERMSRMGKSIEQAVERPAEQLEQRANALCQEFVALDELEQRIASTIPQLQQFNPLRLTERENEQRK